MAYKRVKCDNYFGKMFERLFFFFNLLILERGGGERERNINLLLHLFMHSLVASCMCPDSRSNLQTLLYQDDVLTNCATWLGLEVSHKVKCIPTL